MKKYIVFLLIFICMSFSLFAQDMQDTESQTSTKVQQDLPLVSLRIIPGVNIPVGESWDSSSIGGGGVLAGNFNFNVFTFGLGVDYGYVPVATVSEDESLSYSILGASANLGFNIQVIDNLILSLLGGGGYFYSFFNESDAPDQDGYNPYVFGTLGIAYRVAPVFSIGLQGTYRHFFGLYQDVNVALAATFHFGGGSSDDAVEDVQPEIKPEPMIAEEESDENTEVAEVQEPEKTQTETVTVEGDLAVSEVEIDTLFPVFYQYYEQNPVGKLKLTNNSNVTMEDIYVSMYVAKYMDNPKKVLAAESINAGASKTVDIYALFNNEVLNITGGTTVSVKIDFEYSAGGNSITQEVIDSFLFEDRQACTWDDDRRAAAFVTYQEPAIAAFARNVKGVTGSSRAFSDNILYAIGIHKALELYGISYIVDPISPYATLSTDATSVDFIQFPELTLQNRGGDCDDLSILYAALFENIGVPAAFVTVPGHIFFAFSLEMSKDDALETFSQPDNLIFYNDEAWMPLEITMIDDGFLKAWQTGAKEWREQDSRGQAGFFPIREAWETYKAVGFPENISVVVPDRDELIEEYQKEFDTFITREIYGKIAPIQATLVDKPDDIRALNKLAVTYAQYGLDDKAIEGFQKLLAIKDYAPAYLNIGNLYYLQDDFESALENYEKADELVPNKAVILLSIAKVEHELENYGSAKRYYDQVKILDTSMADKYSYLEFRSDDYGRASDVQGIKETVEWSLEEDF